MQKSTTEINENRNSHPSVPLRKLRYPRPPSKTDIDIDEWCVNNSIDNLALNHIDNINRNILLADMQYYVARMNEGGTIYFSGFYESDLPMIKAEAEGLGLRYVSHRMEKEWTAAKFTR